MIDTDYVNRLLRLRESLVHLDNAIYALDKARPEIASGSNPVEEIIDAYSALRKLREHTEELHREAWNKLVGGG